MMSLFHCDIGMGGISIHTKSVGYVSACLDDVPLGDDDPAMLSRVVTAR